MSDGINITMVGFQDLRRELLTLPASMQQRLVKGAVATGASVIRKEAIARAPMWTGDVAAGHPPPGTLKRSIVQARVADACTDRQEVWKVYVRAGNSSRKTKTGSQTIQGAYYARWVEYGHFSATPRGAGSKKARQTSAILAGAVTWIQAQPFIRPAFESQKEAAVSAMRNYMATNLPLAVVGYTYIKAAA